ncbi:MAG: HDOD domain-containing protein [Oscillospiraceae bacterium]|jgi:EAL and modified HD-GYP domain-containing signal transduction protein|nr:HDOD domain-containing protein [Oscillospiraceae bacterium]
MAKVFAVAEPLFDSQIEVQAYYLHGKNSDSLFDADVKNSGDALQSPTLDIVGQMGTEPFAGSYPMFVPVNEFQLLSGLPASLGIFPSKLIVVVGKDIPFNGAVYQKCEDLKEQGYELAAEGLLGSISPDLFFELFDYLILDYLSQNFKRDFTAMRPHIFKIKFVINNVPSMEAFDSVSKLHGAMFSGDFYSAPVTKGSGEISPIKMNALHLLGQINQEDFELIDVAEIIERDAALSVSLLRFINSAGGFRGTKRVESIRQAVAIMGQNEVKRWATVAITSQLGEDRPSEITRLSLLRGKFAENLADAYELGMLKSGLFISGLLSLLDVILQKPMAEAIADVAVDARIHNALVNKRGIIYEVMELIIAFGRCDWYGVAVNLYRNKVNADLVAQAFIDALVWYRELLERMEEEE